MTTVFFIVPIVLLVLGFPIFMILLITALIWLFGFSGLPPTIIETVAFGSLRNFSLLAIPFFIFAGEIIARGGIAKRVIAWVLSLVGGIRGSLPVATIASSELFGSMSGSSVGSVAAVGRLLLPALRENGYSEQFSVGLITSSGAIAVVIPPAIPMIIYSVTARQPLPTLFLAGVLPALLIGFIAASYVLIYARVRNVPITSRFNFESILKSTRECAWALGTIVVIFGGIYGGIFTPTEAAGVAVVYAFLVSKFIYREMTWETLWQAAESSATLTSQILLILVAAGVYSWMLTTSNIPQAVVGYIQALHAGLVGTLLLINLVLLVIGTFLEPPAAILILAPLFLPVAYALHVNPIHFGIIFCMNLSIGMYAPPVGINIFAANLLFKAPFSKIYRGVLPFMLLNIAALMLITFVPAISLALVQRL